MSRAAPCICRRRRCARPRRKWEYFCADCWGRLPPRLRALITQAGKANRIVARDQLRRDAEAHLDGTSPWCAAPPRISETAA